MGRISKSLSLLLVGVCLVTSPCVPRTRKSPILSAKQADAKLDGLVKDFTANLAGWQKAPDRCPDCHGQMCLLRMEIEMQMEKLGISPQAPSSTLVARATTDFFRAKNVGAISTRDLQKKSGDMLLLALPSVETDITPFLANLQKLVSVRIQLVKDPERIAALRESGSTDHHQAAYRLFVDATRYPILRFGNYFSFRFDLYPMLSTYWAIYELRGDELRLLDWCGAIV